MWCFSPENLWEGWRDRYRQDWKTFLFAFGMGVIFYLRMITQWLTNPDGVWQGLVYKEGYGWENALGRIGLGPFNWMKGYYQFPAVQTIFCIAAAALLSVILCRLFEVRRSPWNYLVGWLVVCSPSLCSTLTYYYTADAYLLSFLASVTAVACVAKKWSWVSYMLAAVLFMISASLYQAYIGSAVTLCLLYLLFMILRREEAFHTIVKKGLHFLTAGVSGVAAYLILYKIVCRIWKFAPVDARGFKHMGRIPLGRLPELIRQAYHFFFGYYFTDELYNNSWMGRGHLNALIFTLFIVLVAGLAIRKRLFRKPGSMFILAVGILFLPLAFMSIVIMAPEVSIAEVTGILMLPHMNWLYIFLIVLAAEADKPDWKGMASKWIVAVTSGWIAIVLSLYVQVFQNCMEMDLHRTYTLAGQIAQDINSEIGYVPEMLLVIGGNAENGNYPRGYEKMYQVVKGTAAENGLFWDSVNGRQNCWNQFFRQYLGLKYGVVGNEQVEAILNSQEYAEMSIYPDKGSVKRIGEFTVVKLSD